MHTDVFRGNKTSIMRRSGGEPQHKTSIDELGKDLRMSMDL